ncbi:phosphatase PAP2 family protein [Amycolatopsis cihanbeyliensis]
MGAGLLMVLLGVPHAGDTGPDALDAAVATAVHSAFAGQDALLRLLVLPTQPAVLLGVLGVLAVTCVLQRRRTGLALVLLGPALAVAVNTWLLKPLFGRYYDDHLAYPSGHTVSLVAVLTVLALLARPRTATRLVILLGCLLLTAAGIGMIGLRYHYLTDILGGAACAVAVVLALAVGLEAAIPARSVPDPGRPRPWTGR